MALSSTTQAYYDARDALIASEGQADSSTELKAYLAACRADRRLAVLPAGAWSFSDPIFLGNDAGTHDGEPGLSGCGKLATRLTYTGSASVPAISWDAGSWNWFGGGYSLSRSGNTKTGVGLMFAPQPVDQTGGVTGSQGTILGGSSLRDVQVAGFGVGMQFGSYDMPGFVERATSEWTLDHCTVVNNDVGIQLETFNTLNIVCNQLGAGGNRIGVWGKAGGWVLINGGSCTLNTEASFRQDHSQGVTLVNWRIEGGGPILRAGATTAQTPCVLINCFHQLYSPTDLFILSGGGADIRVIGGQWLGRPDVQGGFPDGTYGVGQLRLDIGKEEPPPATTRANLQRQLDLIGHGRFSGTVTLDAPLVLRNNDPDYQYPGKRFILEAVGPGARLVCGTGVTYCLEVAAGSAAREVELRGVVCTNGRVHVSTDSDTTAPVSVKVVGGLFGPSAKGPITWTAGSRFAYDLQRVGRYDSTTGTNGLTAGATVTTAGRSDDIADRTSFATATVNTAIVGRSATTTVVALDGWGAERTDNPTVTVKYVLNNGADDHPGAVTRPDPTGRPALYRATATLPSNWSAGGSVKAVATVPEP